MARGYGCAPFLCEEPTRLAANTLHKSILHCRHGKHNVFCNVVFCDVVGNLDL